MSQAPLDTSWADSLVLPPAGNMMSAGSQAAGVFIRQGTRMFGAIEKCITDHMGGSPISELNVLDFGCGVGRVTLPFHHRHKQPRTVCDVDKDALAYVASAIPTINAVRTDYTPPTPFLDNAFDVVFAISVWTHLPEDLQMAWLGEIRRIVKPGGLALLTTSSFRALESRRGKLPDWKDVTDAELTSAGFIFKKAGATKGVTGTYGYALHTADYVRNNWSKYFEVIDIVEGGIEGVQDINVLRRT